MSEVLCSTLTTQCIALYCPSVPLHYSVLHCTAPRCPCTAPAMCCPAMSCLCPCLLLLLHIPMRHMCSCGTAGPRQLIQHGAQLQTPTQLTSMRNSSRLHGRRLAARVKFSLTCKAWWWKGGPCCSHCEVDVCVCIVHYRVYQCMYTGVYCKLQSL